MAINAKDRFAKLPKARQEKIIARADEMMAEEMSLAQLREACMRSQVQLAEKLGIQQAAVSRLERRTDMYISTLRHLIASMGGTLRIVAQFPDRPLVCINQFHDLDIKAAVEAAMVEVMHHQPSSPSSGSTGRRRTQCVKFPKPRAERRRRPTK
jgi:DNA-binding XRE family transcriptional regulator